MGVSRDEPNWTHPSVFERKKILVKNGILRSKKTDQIVCGYKAGPPFVRQRVELARLPAHSDQQSLSLPWFKSFMVQQNLKPKVLFCEKAKFLCFIPTISKHQPFHSKRSYRKVQKPKKRQE